MGKKSLVALDTDHIKGYVFGTNKLKEIRGASSQLDSLNRIRMEFTAEDRAYKARPIYANGGSGLFLVDMEKAESFGKEIQKLYKETTGGGSSITYIVQELPKNAPDNVEEIMTYPLRETLELMHYRLREAKSCPPDLISLPSHPLMRVCDACGVRYADAGYKFSLDIFDPDERIENVLLCTSCIKKRERDNEVKRLIERVIKEGESIDQLRYEDFLWTRLLELLRNEKLEEFYEIPPDTQRPPDFNSFSNFNGAKDYLALIYADGNGMGQKFGKFEKLQDYEDFAKLIDTSIYKAVCVAIKRHLKIRDHLKPGNDSIFPFDMLLLGGDDVLMVTPASVALDVAKTIAKEFSDKTNGHTLSVGVVLAPVKYPFGLLLDLVEGTLKFAKKAGAKRGAEQKIKQARTQTGNKPTGTQEGDKKVDDSLINFMTVTGSTSLSFNEVYQSLCREKDKEGNLADKAFYATLRPYNLEELEMLLRLIRDGQEKALGRTKLHQLREVILKKNLSSSVSDGLALLRSWKADQRFYVYSSVYEFAKRFQVNHSTPDDPGSLFPRLTFPWFVDGQRRYEEKVQQIYRTPLLDFIELHDFVARKDG